MPKDFYKKCAAGSPFLVKNKTGPAKSMEIWVFPQMVGFPKTPKTPMVVGEIHPPAILGVRFTPQPGTFLGGFIAAIEVANSMSLTASSAIPTNICTRVSTGVREAELNEPKGWIYCPED